MASMGLSDPIEALGPPFLTSLTSRSLQNHNFLNFYPIGASEVSIGIYSSRTQL